MALTKASVVVRNDIAMVASAASTTSATQDVSGAYRTVVRIRFTNGGTGPTIAGQCSVQASEDTTGANFMQLAVVNGGTVNSAVSEYVIEVPDTAFQVRTVDGSNTGQNVTIRTVLEKITAL